MKILLFMFCLILLSCNHQSIEILKTNSQQYFVERIEISGNWYIIYLNNNGNKYKVVSKNETNNSCYKIKKNKKYNFVLHSRRENPPEINGIKIEPMNYLENRCFSYDEQTLICLEPKNGIYDLYYAENLKGLCINKN